MNTLPADKLAALRVKFMQRLGQRASDMQLALDALRACCDQANQIKLTGDGAMHVETLKRLAHSLKGAALQYDLPELSAQAANVEHQFNAWQTVSLHGDIEPYVASVEALMTTCSALVPS